MTEWLKVLAWNASVVNSYRGFESLSLRKYTKILVKIPPIKCKDAYHFSSIEINLWIEGPHELFNRAVCQAERSSTLYFRLR